MKTRTSFFLGLTAFLIPILLVWYSNRPIAPEPTTWDDVLTQAETGGYRIVTTEELADMYRRDPHLLMIDTRQEWEYRTGHMEGALNFSMEPTWWERWRKADALKDFLGPDKERNLVFY